VAQTWRRGHLWHDERREKGEGRAGASVSVLTAPSLSSHVRPQRPHTDAAASALHSRTAAPTHPGCRLIRAGYEGFPCIPAATLVSNRSRSTHLRSLLHVNLPTLLLSPARSQLARSPPISHVPARGASPCGYWSCLLVSASSGFSTIDECLFINRNNRNNRRSSMPSLLRLGMPICGDRLTLWRRVRHATGGRHYVRFGFCSFRLPLPRCSFWGGTSKKKNGMPFLVGLVRGLPLLPNGGCERTRPPLVSHPRFFKGAQS
jgi:hypothetical protein